MKQKLMEQKRKTERFTIIELQLDISILLSVTNRTSKQKTILDREQDRNQKRAEKT